MAAVGSERLLWQRARREPLDHPVGTDELVFRTRLRLGFQELDLPGIRGQARSSRTPGAGRRREGDRLRSFYAPSRFRERVVYEPDLGAQPRYLHTAQPKFLPGRNLLPHGAKKLPHGEIRTSG